MQNLDEMAEKNIQAVEKQKRVENADFDGKFPENAGCKNDERKLKDKRCNNFCDIFFHKDSSKCYENDRPI